MASIPKVIHKIIITEDGKIPPFPEGLKRAVETWYRMNPEYKIKFYSGEECERYVEEHYDERTLAAYRKIKPFAFKCDFVRQLILLKEGGWYSDLRQVCLRSLETLVSQTAGRTYYITRDCPPNELCMYNALIGAAPGHPITQKYIDAIIFNVEHDHYGLDCLYATGPGVFMYAAIDHLRAHPDKCVIGLHTKDEHVEFGGVRFVKCKYNVARGADNSDLPGTNDYGDMWRRRDIYLHKHLTR